MQVKHSSSLMIGLSIGAVVAGGVLWLLWSSDPTEEAQQGVWTCSMHPQIRQTRPGKCPICGMDLVPASQLSSEQARLRERSGIETARVAYRELFKDIRTVGKIDYNERQAAFITARIAGLVDRVYADFTGTQVKKGDHLAEIYSPELFIAQGELIRALEAATAARQNPAAVDGTFVETTLDAARTKLRLLGIVPNQIADIEKTRKAETYLTIFAPSGGTVIEKQVRAGQYVKEGDVLYRIADLDPIWLYVDVYEYDLGWVRHGQRVDVTVEAFPGELFSGKVAFIDPFLDDKTRTVKARVNLPNPERRLKPGMYASASIRVRLQGDGTPEPTGLEGKFICPMHPEIVRDNPDRCPLCAMPLDRVPERRPPAHQAHQHEGHEHVLAVAVSAVLDTGRRTICYRQTNDGPYELVELKLGPRAEGKDDTGRATSYYPVLAGLQPGDRVVARGGFLLDSQRQIEGLPSLLYPEGQAATSLHAGHGAPAPPKPSADSPAHKH